MPPPPPRAYLVTGCDSGFGRILLDMLYKHDPTHLVLPCCFTEAGLAEIAKTYPDARRVRAMRVDVTSDESVRRLAEEVKRVLESDPGKHALFGLVNNAGLLVNPAPSEWLTTEPYERMLNVNLLGVVRVTNAFLPPIRASQGRIVNVTSIAGRVGLGFNAAYCASKFAVAGYSEVLRREMASFGVNVSIIEPGVFAQTGLYAQFQKGLDAVWRGLDPNLKRDYGEDYYKFARGALGITLKGMSNKDVNIVPSAMLHALTSDRPKRRYRCGIDSKYVIAVLEKVPDAIQDRVLMGSGKGRAGGPPIIYPATGSFEKRTAALERFEDDSLAFKVGGLATAGLVGYGGFSLLRSFM